MARRWGEREARIKDAADSDPRLVVATANTLTSEEPPAALGGVIVASRSAAASGAARSASGLADERAAPESSGWLLLPCRASAGDPSRCERTYGGDHYWRSGKNRATSRAADSGPSEPWTMF